MVNRADTEQSWQSAFSPYYLIMINLSGMKFREKLKEIQWPLAKSQTLQSIHLSDNNIPKAVETNMLMVFGVKSNEGDADFSIAGKLDQRQ